MDPSLRTTGLIKSDAVKLVGLATPSVDNISSDIKVELDGGSGYLRMKWPTYPDESKLKDASNVKDISLRNSNGEVIVAASGTSLFSFSKLYGPIKYMADVTVSGRNNNTQHITSDTNEASANLSVSPGDKVHVDMYYAYETGNFKSNVVSADQTVTAYLTLPSAGYSKADLENWCANNPFATLTTAKKDDNHPAGSFTMVDSNGVTHNYGEQLTINSSLRLTITYYTEPDHNLSIIAVTSEDHKSAKLTVQYDSDSKWSGWNISGNSSSFNISGTDNEELSILVAGTEGSITVYANTDNKQASATVSINSEDQTLSVVTN